MPSIAGEDTPGDTDPTLAVSSQELEFRPQQQKQQQRQPNSVSWPEKPVAGSSAHSRQLHPPRGHLECHRMVQKELGRFGGGHPHQAYHPTRVGGSQGGDPHAASPPLSAGAGVGGVPGVVPGVAGVPGVTPGVGAVPGLVPGLGIPGTGILPGAGTCFVPPQWVTCLWAVMARDAKGHRDTWRGGR